MVGCDLCELEGVGGRWEGDLAGGEFAVVAEEEGEGVGVVGGHVG